MFRSLAILKPLFLSALLLGNTNAFSACDLTLNAPTGSATTCDLNTAVYTVTAASGTITSIVSWSLPAGASVRVQTFTATTITATIYFSGTSGDVSVTASDGCVSPTSPTLTITLWLPAIHFLVATMMDLMGNLIAEETWMEEELPLLLAR